MPTSTSKEAVVVQESMGFHEHASSALGSLRAALSDMLADLPGGVRKSDDLKKLIGLDIRLSWQIFKLTGPGDPISLVPHVPLPAAFERLLTAATKHGIRTQSIAAVRHAFENFEKLVEDHAGDRSVFDTMTRGLADDETSQQNDLSHRKSMFKGNRHYLASEIETAIGTVFNFPTAKAGNVDVGSMRCRLGMRRLRNSSEIIIDRARIFDTGSDEQFTSQNTLDPVAAKEYGIALLPEFSTNPLPAFKVNDGPKGQRVTILSGPAIGKKSPVDLVFANVWHDVPFLTNREDGSQSVRALWYVNYPTIRLYMDFIVPKNEFHELNPTAEVFGYASEAADVHETQNNLPILPFNERIVRLAGGINGAQIREVPRYVQMLKFFCQRMNQPFEEFEVFRYFVEYPIICSLISLRFQKGMETGRS